MGNLADDMRKRAQDGRLQTKKFNDELKRCETERLDQLKNKGVEEAEKIFPKCMKQIEDVARRGDSKLHFTAKTFTNPCDEEKYIGNSLINHLSMLLEKEGFKARIELHRSEGDIDDQRDFYWYNVEVSWE